MKYRKNAWGLGSWEILSMLFVQGKNSGPGDLGQDAVGLQKQSRELSGIQSSLQVDLRTGGTPTVISSGLSLSCCDSWGTTSKIARKLGRCSLISRDRIWWLNLLQEFGQLLGKIYWLLQFFFFWSQFYRNTVIKVWTPTAGSHALTWPSLPGS